MNDLNERVGELSYTNWNRLVYSNIDLWSFWMITSKALRLSNVEFFRASL